MRTKKQKDIILGAYLITFYALWAFYELLAKDFLHNVISNDVLRQLVQEGFIKNFIWTLPAVFLIRRFSGNLNISLKEMFTTKVMWLKYLPVFLMFTLYLLGGAFLQQGTLTVSPEFGIEQAIDVIFVGLTEEIVFRGWLLNAEDWEHRKWMALLANALLFLLIHFPIWIKEGVFLSCFADLSFLCIIALSLIFGWSYIKSRNILVPIALHMYWDLLVFLFY